MEEIIQKQLNSIATIYSDKLLPVFLNKITIHHEAMSKIESLQKRPIVTKPPCTESAGVY
jgi:hypothetical protein